MPEAATVSAASNPQLMIRRAVLSLQNFLLQLLFISIFLFPYFSTHIVCGPVSDAQARIVGGCPLLHKQLSLKTCDVLRKKKKKLKKSTNPLHGLSIELKSTTESQ